MSQPSSLGRPPVVPEQERRHLVTTMMQPESGGVPSNYKNGFCYKSTSSSRDNDALEHTKKQVENVKGILGENVQRIIARGENFNDLDERVTKLTANAKDFKRVSRNLKNKMWWEDIKMKLVLGLIIIIVIVIIFVAVVGVPSGGSSVGSTVPTTTIHPSVIPSKAVEAGIEVAKNITKRSLGSLLQGASSEETFKDHGT